METLFPLLDNINDYVVLIYRKYVDLDRNNRIFRPGEKKLCNTANQTVKLYGCKSDQFA